MKHFRLDSDNSTFVLDLSGSGIPLVSYWGSRLTVNAPLKHLAHSHTPPAYQAGLDTPYRLNMFPEEGTGFKGKPALSGDRNGRNWATRFKMEEVISVGDSAGIRLIDRVSSNFRDAPKIIRFY